MVNCSCIHTKENVMISDLAYSKLLNKEHLVYVREGEVYEPYLVLTKDYNGNTLLLRKNLLDKTRRINDYSSFYENSEIDFFLNSDFYDLLTDVKPIIKNSNVEITDDNSIGYSGDESTTISRKIFLLSCTEIDVDNSVNQAVEGVSLDYFSNEDNRIAYCKDNAMNWWLRTPNSYYVSCSYSVGNNGKIGSGNSSDCNGIRPAFCVDNSEIVALRDDIIQGKSVYVFYLD